MRKAKVAHNFIYQVLGARTHSLFPVRFKTMILICVAHTLYYAMNCACLERKPRSIRIAISFNYMGQEAHLDYAIIYSDIQRDLGAYFAGI